VRIILAALVVCALLAASASADGPPSNIRLDPAHPGVVSFAFRAGPSVIRIAYSLVSTFLPDTFGEEPCAVLILRTPSPNADVEVTTFGLGHATLATGRDPARACQPGFAGDGKERLHLAYSGQPEVHDWILVVRPDPQPIAASGTAMEGQIVAFAEGVGMITLPLKVERLPMSPLLSSLVWAFGFVLPALLTYRLGRAADRWSDRRTAAREAAARQIELADKAQAARLEQAEAFRAWRQEPGSRQAIQRLVNEITIAIKTPEAAPHCLRLFQSMHTNGLFTKMPVERYEMLLEICRAEDYARLLGVLRELFPERPDIPAEWKGLDEQ
jgi:hypothetical protein